MVIAFFSNSTFHLNKINTQIINSLEWTLNSPIPLHAYKMLPIQS